MPYNGYALKLPSANSTYYEINSVLLRACLLWKQLPLSIKQSQSLLEFKSKMKTLSEILSALARYAGHGFVVMYYEQIPL